MGGIRYWKKDRTQRTMYSAPIFNKTASKTKSLKVQGEFGKILMSYGENMSFSRLNGKCQINPFFRRNVVKMLLTISLAVLLIFAGIVPAACPGADANADCKVNLDDFAIMASEWLTTYDVNDLAASRYCGRYYRLGGQQC